MAKHTITYQATHHTLKVNSTLRTEKIKQTQLLRYFASQRLNATIYKHGAVAQTMKV